MADTFQPENSEQLQDAILSAATEQIKLSIQGGGSKREVGGPSAAATTLDMRGLAGILEYDPAELVITVCAGTRLCDVQDALAAENQMLAFDPIDHGDMLGQSSGVTTIGGVMATGLAGPGRLSRGSVRDHLLGFEAVSGRGETFAAGAKVVKNVTGYDLPKVLAGSWGRLAACTKMTFKTMPRPESAETFILPDLSPESAINAMSLAMGSTANVAAAAHVPNWQNGRAATALRLDGIPASISARAETLSKLFAETEITQLDQEEDGAFWHRASVASFIDPNLPLWRLVTPPSRACFSINRLIAADCVVDWMFDWAGALTWVATDASADTVFKIAAESGGHAKLIRADAETRSRHRCFQPQPEPIENLERRLRRAFDPLSVFETGRFGA